MANVIAATAVHHVTLTITDIDRSCTFYEELLGFQKIAEFGPKVIMNNGHITIGLAPPPDPAQAIEDDSFNENRVGLDHLSLAVDSREVLEQAVRLFDEQGVDHGDIKDLGAGFGIYVLAFRDPDNIQLELTAPYAAN